MHQRFIVFLLVVTGVVLTATVAEACPTCKEGLAEGGGHVARGYFWSILFMMSMPFLILGGLGSLFYLEVRRARLLQEQATRSDNTIEPVAIPVPGTS